MDRSNLPPDENLPEVVPDQSPQALPKESAPQYEAHLGEKDPKYPVILEDTPKLTSEHEGTPTAAAAIPGSVSPGTTIPWEARSPEAVEQGLSRAPTEPPVKEEKTILGLKRRVFIILVVVLVIVAAALGGGLGGGLSKKNKNSAEPSNEGDDDANTTPTPTAPESSSSASSSSASATPTLPNFLNNETLREGGFAFQAFSSEDYGGEAGEVIIDEGYFDFGFEALSYVWLPNNMNCCITFCEDKKNGTGYWCQQRFRNESSDSFPRVAIHCGDNVDRIGSCS